MQSAADSASEAVLPDGPMAALGLHPHKASELPAVPSYKDPVGMLGRIESCCTRFSLVFQFLEYTGKSEWGLTGDHL